MDQEPPRPVEPRPMAHAPELADDKPKFFYTVNGMIAGVTGLLIALGGAVTAYKNVWPGMPAQPQAAAQPAVSQPAAAAEAVDSREEEVAGDEGPPASYTTDDGGTLRWVDGMWVERAADGARLRYDEISNDGVMTVAVLPGGGEEGEDVYLRWPDAGGQAQKSWDRQDSWQDAYNVAPDA